MQFIDLKAQQERIREGLERRILNVLDHGRFILGPEVFELEEKLAQYVGVKHCISCSSGTDALLMPLMALEVGPGDAVFVPSFTFVASAEVIVLLGATPVFVDIDPRTFNIDPRALEATIEAFLSQSEGARARGIIAVNLFGQPADYEEINDIASRYGLFVIEDAAQSFGAEYRGKKSGALAPIAATSFFPAKPLGCYGDGGAVFCSDDDLAEKLCSIRQHGQGTNKYDNVRVGINGRFDTLQAAVLLEKLAIFDEERKLRNEVAGRYAQGLAGKVTVPEVRSDRSSVWAQYSVLSDAREDCLSRLKTAGIPAAIYYPKPLHLQEAYACADSLRGALQVTEDIAQRIFSLPMHPYLSEEDQARIIQSI